MSGLDHIRDRVMSARSISPAEIAEAMTDEELLAAVMSAGHSAGSAAAAVDVFRMVLEAVADGKVTPRAGWARG